MSKVAMATVMEKLSVDSDGDNTVISGIVGPEVCLSSREEEAAVGSGFRMTQLGKMWPPPKLATEEDCFKKKINTGKNVQIITVKSQNDRHI
jgi:hypothetical protein